MSQAKKMLDAMRANPKGDWQMADFETICLYFQRLGHNVTCHPPRGGGSHFKVTFPTGEILTPPYRRPIKPVYVRKFVSILDSINSDSA